MERLRLGVNIDHVATVRNARGTAFPDPVRAALIAEAAAAQAAAEMNTIGLGSLLAVVLLVALCFRSPLPVLLVGSSLLVGVGAGADALMKAGHTPQLIVGDPSEVSSEALTCGADVVVPAFADGHAPGLHRVEIPVA